MWAHLLFLAALAGNPIFARAGCSTSDAVRRAVHMFFVVNRSLLGSAIADQAL